MTALSAVRPYGSSVVNSDVIRREGGGIICDRHESGIKSNLTAGRRQSQRAAGGCERRLSDSVVLLLELEGNHIANLRGDVGRVVEEFARSTNDNCVDLRGG